MPNPNPIQWAVRPLKRYATFSGRAPRPEYWWFIAVVVAGSFLTDFADNLIGTSDALSTIFNLSALVPSIAVAVRRLHDTDRRGWWLLVYVVPSIVVVVAAIWVADYAVPNENLIPLFVAMGIAMFAAAVTLFVFLVLPGTEGSNRYGPDPYGADELEEVFA